MSRQPIIYNVFELSSYEFDDDYVCPICYDTYYKKEVYQCKEESLIFINHSNHSNHSNKQLEILEGRLINSVTSNNLSLKSLRFTRPFYS
ncbi:hypothetical protein DICPUDRAFT_148559 [Dictyostelium purpureum]|uniref:Uncharacterized protein n=1 Tax=Dictyostelium purpureum TaxID=5786 RepID=F0ZBF8_DICPU|nr:uncharacterized protein DICPUDRAFT_148559 [Dictyostelium purpureum]EGC38741.1 hypothetical protein DICPUDRAFT_148559 [Dictyostelium purpureum]|eukprot:XP_003284732.1 hypothetical protein DICPUDRAFT_148559 [Dictyostelium purpureum]